MTTILNISLSLSGTSLPPFCLVAPPCCLVQLLRLAVLLSRSAFSLRSHLSVPTITRSFLSLVAVSVAPFELQPAPSMLQHKLLIPKSTLRPILTQVLHPSPPPPSPTLPPLFGSVANLAIDLTGNDDELYETEDSRMGRVSVAREVVDLAAVRGIVKEEPL
ncbi:hypothetical protein F5051DRAFT_444694 [Lentinula edodes]|nr:hypothetical protein F5051DRAFT_444694 [Lentinula edodes]